MGRFEKRPENSRNRSDLSRAAENALWDVVEDLEQLQQNVIRTLQDDVKRLETEKNRLANDIQRLIEEKEKLQQARQITEQQVLIRQLAEVLAKHISSQLQSSLKSLAEQSITGESSDQSTLRSAEVNSTVASEISENVSQMLNNLDDTVTIAFSSIQQELTNYQSHLSQQLLRMYDQQQQGEEILAEFVKRLRSELEKTKDTNSLKMLTGGAPTVLQLGETHKNGFSENSSQRIVAEPVSLLTQELPKSGNLSSDAVVVLPLPPEHPPEPISVLVPESFTSETSETLTPENPTPEHPAEPISVLVPESFTSETSETLTSKNPTPEHPAEPISVLVPESFTSETSETLTSKNPTPEHPAEPISVLVPESFTSETSETLTPENPTPEHPPEPVSVIVPESSPAKLNPYSPQQIQQEVTPRQQKPPSSPNKSSVQIGFLLVVLSTVMSSLYNVVVKALFYQGSDLLGNFQTQQLISPTLGNIFLILMLRLLVVVPLMLLLAPILHPPVWQDLQSLFDSVSRNAAAKKTNTKQVLLLSVVSGGLLFLSQVLIYIAIGQVTTGVAIALFFIYPMITSLLAWFLFRERPGLLSFSAISSIFCGQLLILGSYSTGINNTSLGIISGIMSGIAFSAYVILTRLSAPKLHPVSFALINFATMLLFSFVCLLVPLPSDWSLALRSANLLEVILSAFMLGVLTLCGYLFNNFGIRKLGGQRSALIGAVVPVLTVIFAGLMIQEKLDILQILGVLLVTGGAVGITWEKMQNVKSSIAKN
ncbi:EamA family transporter [Sphaerospermopsis torques-reginae]|uniref:EamA family transporter n=1 Tax=Sphaerospermopsis torques-reginae ITEP-024 TaxID=984208 RepID=A0ABX8WYY5_9CYAN|nr:EamA family transporter [Sphaerospermopsis torques-reginae]QYX31585.1 EamA family transporter [Sphaerospermopsis torques-reginae ITEP-024]